MREVSTPVRAPGVCQIPNKPPLTVDLGICLLARPVVAIMGQGQGAKPAQDTDPWLDGTPGLQGPSSASPSRVGDMARMGSLAFQRILALGSH